MTLRNLIFSAFPEEFPEITIKRNFKWWIIVFTDTSFYFKNPWMCSFIDENKSMTVCVAIISMWIFVGKKLWNFNDNYSKRMNDEDEKKCVYDVSLRLCKRCQNTLWKTLQLKFDFIFLLLLQSSFRSIIALSTAVPCLEKVLKLMMIITCVTKWHVFLSISLHIYIDICQSRCRKKKELCVRRSKR